MEKELEGMEKKWNEVTINGKDATNGKKGMEEKVRLNGKQKRQLWEERKERKKKRKEEE